MRFRLTVLLLLANAVLFFAIWSLEREKPEAQDGQSQLVAFTTLEISGKNIEKPRILKLENNKWRIVSPIEWSANLFAVNRIRNQLEFLDKEASFSLSEVSKHGHTLAEYGLDDPAYVIKYGNGEKMYSLKIGKSAPIGDRIYMLDDFDNKVVVVDREFVEGLVVDIERLRNQSVFDIPRFEVSAFSIRLPVGDSKAAAKSAFRRIGLKRDGNKWKFETPIVAAADPREVDAFLNELCQTSAKSFVIDPNANTGFEISALPATIIIQGTNRRQVLLLGGLTKDGTQMYARLEDNPTVFTVDASLFKNIKDIQTALREKSFLRFDYNATVGIDISKGGKTLKLRKLKSGVWDVIGAGANGETLTAAADPAYVSDLLVKLEGVRARQFVSDAPGENTSEYGIGPNSTRIVATQADQSSVGITIGSEYDYGVARLMYAKADGSDAVYGISRELASAADTDFLRYRSRILEVLPDTAVVNSLKITNLKTSKVVFEIKAGEGGFTEALRKFPPRSAVAAEFLLKAVKHFGVRSYLAEKFSPKGVKLPDGKFEDWELAMEAGVDLPGTGATVSESRKWLFTRRFGGTTQYGGSAASDSVFELSQMNIDALFELARERENPKELEKPAPSAPGKM